MATPATTSNQKIKVLFLPAWYPVPADPMFGLFVQKHAGIVSEACDVVVLHACAAPEQFSGIKITEHATFSEWLVFYQPKRKGLFKGVVNFLRWALAYYRGWRQLKKSRGLPALVHVNILTRVALPALFLKIRYNIPYLISEHWSRYYFPGKTFRNPLHRLLTRLAIRKASALTVVSSALGEAMKKQGLCHHYKLLPNVIETRLFKPIPPSENRYIKRIIHISCFEEQSKNLSGILEAIKILSQKREDFVLQMVGVGMDLDFARQRAAALHLSPERVRFEGLMEGETLANTLAQADFSILLSHYETFGIVVYESLSCGVPVVVSPVADFERDIDNRLGIVVKSFNPGDFADALDHMLNTCHTYDRAYMREYVENRFSEDSIRNQMLALYQQILKIP